MKLSWRGVNALLLVCTAVQFTTEGHLNAFTPLLLHDLGLTPPEVAVWSGLLFAIMTAMALPLAPFWGVLAERFARRPIILRSYYLLAGSLLVAAWAPDISALILGRMLIGLSFGTMGIIIGTQALLVPRRSLGASIATVQAAQPIAASLGPPLGAFAIPAIGLRGLFVVDAVVTLLAALAMTLLLPEPEQRVTKGSVLGRTREVLGLVWTIRPVRWNFFSAFMLRGATSVIDSYLPVRITQVADDPPSAIGWILGLYGVVSTGATWLLGRIIHRTDELKLYWRTMLYATVVTAGLAAAPWLWLVGLLAVLRAIPVAFGNTLLHTHATRVLPREHQTPILGLAPMPRNVGSLVFPLAAATAASLVAGAGLAASLALAIGAVAYGGTFLAGLGMIRVTRVRGPEMERRSD